MAQHDQRGLYARWVPRVVDAENAAMRHILRSIACVAVILTDRDKLKSMVIGKSKYISQPWVYGNSFLPMLVAVVVPAFDKLRAAGIETLALCGFLTNCCVESTMRTAFEKGFNVVTVTDCCAATSAEGHAAATTGTFGMFSKPMTAAELTAVLAPDTKAAGEEVGAAA